jgi:pimeloyl-ACP methyl ester carboxylesterase
VTVDRVIREMRPWLAIILATALGTAFAPWVAAQQSVTFNADDGAVISADLYAVSSGEVKPMALILAHGGRFTKESWRPQAERWSAAGWRVLAIDFRGFGQSSGPGDDDPLAAPLHLDLLGAARYLRSNGATSVAVVGGSLGGMAAGDALLNSNAAEIERVVFLGAPASLAGSDVSKMGGRKLFIIARDDPSASGQPRLARIRDDF